MRILYLGDAQSIHTQRWVKYFANLHQVAIISNRPALLDNITIHDIGNMSYIQKIVAIRNIIKTFKPDIVHSHYVTSYGFLGALSGFHPFVLTGWGSDILVTPYKNWIFKQLTKFILNKADIITVDAQDMAIAIHQLSPSCDDKTQVIQWGVDIEHFNTKSKTTNKSDLGLQNDFIILSTRNLEPNYNIDTIINSFAKFAAQIPDAKLLMLGNGSQKDSLITLIKKLGIETQVKFIGYTLYDEIDKYYKSADIFISVPTSDATSMSLLEAMACGAIPVVSDIPANHEWITDKANGFIVDHNNIDNISDIFNYIYKNQHLIEQYGKTNYNIIASKANHLEEMKKMEVLYKNLVK